MTIKRGWYKHFKGGYYYVTGTATHSETGEQMVIYHHQGEPSKLWVRPASMWHELVNGEPRFKYIADNFVCSDSKCTYSIEPKEVRDYE